MYVYFYVSRSAFFCITLWLFHCLHLNVLICLSHCVPIWHSTIRHLICLVVCIFSIIILYRKNFFLSNFVHVCQLQSVSFFCPTLCHFCINILIFLSLNVFLFSVSPSDFSIVFFFLSSCVSCYTLFLSLTVCLLSVTPFCPLFHCLTPFHLSPIVSLFQPLCLTVTFLNVCLVLSSCSTYIIGRFF